MSREAIKDGKLETTETETLEELQAELEKEQITRARINAVTIQPKDVNISELNRKIKLLTP